MAQAAIHAGLLQGEQIERELESTTARCDTAFLESLDELERVKAEAFLVKAREVAQSYWDTAARGVNGGNSTILLEMDASYTSADDEIAAPPSVVDDDNEGSEVESGGRKLSSIRVQRELSRLADGRKNYVLWNTYLRIKAIGSNSSAYVICAIQRCLTGGSGIWIQKLVPY